MEELSNKQELLKGKKISKHATSDWMEIEKQEGLSVTFFSITI